MVEAGQCMAKLLENLQLRPEGKAALTNLWVPQVVLQCHLRLRLTLLIQSFFLMNVSMDLYLTPIQYQ